MKILMLTNKMPYPPKDGGSIASLSLALSFKKCGNDVSILTMNTNKHYFERSSIPEYIVSNVNVYSVDVNIEIKIIEAINNLLFSKVPYNAKRFISNAFNSKLKEILIENNYDVVQLEGLYLCPYIDTIRKYSNAKIALRSHNIEHEIWVRTATNEPNFIKRAYIKNLAKRIKNYKLKYLNDYDFLIPITKRDGDIYNSLGNNKPVHVSVTGVNKDRYTKHNENPEFPGFFHIGALDWIPNQEGLKWFFDKIWSKFVKKYPDAKFYLAGRNAPANFEKYILAQKIEYLGEINDANEFIDSKSVMIVPLLSGSGMRIKIIEGMALGKTIITTPIGTEGIETTHDENILIADSADEFLIQLKNIYNNKELHNKISNNALNFITNNYDNYKIAENLVEFYNENIGK
jgi:glycosyltransferase involved in cell wall biosynthesis